MAFEGNGHRKGRKGAHSYESAHKPGTRAAPTGFIKETGSLKDYWRYVFSTTMIPDSPMLVNEPRDPADECKHGRLAGDKTPPCGCWGGK